MSGRHVVVTADDFGQSPGINRGVIEASERGIVTSTSLMVRWPAAAEAARYGRRHARLSVGLHLDFGEWTYRDRTWIPLYQVVNTSDASAVAGEVARQLEMFERLVERPPTHIDSHQHVHLREPARTAVLAAARRLNVPVRSLTPSICYCGRFYGQDARSRPYPQNISVENLIAILSGLGPGMTEIGCHPAAFADLNTMYRFGRLTELRTLCDLRVRRALTETQVTLTSFLEWGAHAASKN